MAGIRQKIPPQDRLSAILRRVNAGGTVAVSDLAREFNISDMTVRRDLSELSRDGMVERVHGGARRPTGGPLRLLDDIEPTFDARAAQNRAAKLAIARAAAEALVGFRSIAMDIGTTSLLTAEALANQVGIEKKHVFTNSLRIAGTLAGCAGEVYTSGGRVRLDELSLLGSAAVEAFAHLNFEVAVLGVSGVTDEGFFDYSIEETEMKLLYLNRAAHRIVVCDSSKFHRLSTTRICALGSVDVLITDAAPPRDLESALRGAGVALRIAAPN